MQLKAAHIMLIPPIFPTTTTFKVGWAKKVTQLSSMPKVALESQLLVQHFNTKVALDNRNDEIGLPILSRMQHLGFEPNRVVLPHVSKQT